MADPRKDNEFEGIDSMPLTFKHDSSIVYSRTAVNGSAQVGLAVSLVGAKQVGLGANGARVEGRLEKVESDGFCHVNCHGGMSLPSAGVIANGAKIVAAGAGNIRAAAEPGAAYAEATADDQANARGEVLDGSVAAAIKVFLRD